MAADAAASTSVSDFPNGIAAALRAFRDGTDTPSRLLNRLLARIERLDPVLASFVTLDTARAAEDTAASDARWAAGRPCGALDGVPIGVKDVIDVAGLPTTCHSRLRSRTSVEHDAFAVARLRQAGAIVLGKLATHEFAIGGPAFDLPFPPARNPWNPARHPGGSSSGAGAAVAAGLVLGAVGTDTAGSVRNPAGACGIVGIKPTYGLVSRGGVFPLAWTLDHVGPLARTAEDTALLLDVMAADDPADPASVARPRGPSYAAGIDAGVSGWRFGVVRHFHRRDMIADPETTEAFERVTEHLAALGGRPVAIELSALTEFANVNRVILQSEGFSIHAADLRDRPAAYGAATRHALLPGAFLHAEDLVAAMRRRSTLIGEVDAAFDRCDVLVTASSMTPACAIDDPAEIARTYMLQARTPFNVTGHPALAMMSGLSARGLPLSIQFAAPYFGEDRLFRVARAVERLTGAPRPADAILLPASR